MSNCSLHNLSFRVCIESLLYKYIYIYFCKFLRSISYFVADFNSFTFSSFFFFVSIDKYLSILMLFSKNNFWLYLFFYFFIFEKFLLYFFLLSYYFNLSVLACWLSCFSCVWLFATLWTVACLTLLSIVFFRQEYWSGLLCSLQGIFSTQWFNPSFLCLLNWHAGSLPQTPPRNPIILLYDCVLLCSFVSSLISWEANILISDASFC